MSNRKLPFGYEMRQGRICINMTEASIVKDVYRTYSSGASYNQITDNLNAQTIPYNKPGKPWNKNMVARILGNKVYMGSDPYPAILSVEEYRRAVSAKPTTGAAFNAKRKVIRQLARCAACGSTLILSENKFGWARWNCPSCNGISVGAVMPDTVEALSIKSPASSRESSAVSW